MTAIYQKPLHIILYKQVKNNKRFFNENPTDSTLMACFNTVIGYSGTLMR